MKWSSLKMARKVNPTGSFSIHLPEGVQEDCDESVMSYWLPGSNVLLQLSSYRRESGEQISAAVRLRERLGVAYDEAVGGEAIQIAECPDIGVASETDDEGTRWVYCYAVWPDLTILATISGLPNDIRNDGGWALEAITSIRKC